MDFWWIKNAAASCWLGESQRSKGVFLDFGKKLGHGLCMKFPSWMLLFHRRWYAARGKGVRSFQRAFRCGWEELLDDAKISSAEDRGQSVREAEDWENKGMLCLHRHRHRRYLIEAISLPLEAENQWCEMLGVRLGLHVAEDLRPLVERWSRHGHDAFSFEWKALCDCFLLALQEAKSVAGLEWDKPMEVEELFAAMHWLTSRDVTVEIPVRQASVELGHDSKWLENQRTRLERLLALMMSAPSGLEQWGVMPQEYLLEMSGPLRLHFADGSEVDVDPLQAVVAISSADIRRALRISSSAWRVLTVENRKTTFRQLAIANRDRTTLLIASSYPTQALCDLIAKISPSIPWHHFGDTDPAGWHILSTMRRKSGWAVKPFLMRWRDREMSMPLSARDQILLENMLNDPMMEDVHGDLCLMQKSGGKGDYEQESLGPPDLCEWPFFSGIKNPLPPR